MSFVKSTSALVPFINIDIIKILPKNKNKDNKRY